MEDRAGLRSSKEGRGGGIGGWVGLVDTWAGGREVCSE